MKRIFVFLLTLLPFVVQADSYKEADIKNGATITGTVRLKGTPRIEQLKVLQDNASCGTSKISPALVMGKNNTVANAVISLQGITQGKKFSSTQAVIINQDKCEYIPHITIVPLGAKFQMVNSDPILHNVHSYDMGKTDAVGRPDTLFNIALPVAGMKRLIAADSPGVHMTLCDAGHPWMNAYVLVTEHPYYAVTDMNGSFTIDNVPPGTYKIKMWHEGVPALQNGKLDFNSDKPYEVEKSVTVAAGAKANVDFEFTLR